MGRFTHPGSRRNFLGGDTTKAMVEAYSNELQVSSATPPTFVVHAQNDSTVNVRNSLLFYNALIEKNVQASIHIFPQGGHGIGLVDNPGSTDLWLDLLNLWLREKGKRMRCIAESFYICKDLMLLQHLHKIISPRVHSCYAAVDE